MGDLCSIPGLGRSPGEGISNPLRDSGLENSMDYTVHGVAKGRTQLSDFHFDLPGGSDGKESACNAGDLGLIPGLGSSPGEGNGNPLAWRIPWMEKPGRLQSMGSQRVRHD